MSVAEIILPDRTQGLKHIDECFQVHLRNQILETVLQVFDRFNHEWLDDSHMKVIQEHDRITQRLDHMAGVWGVIDFSNGRDVDLPAVRRETVGIVATAFKGRITPTRGR